jgi:hypothetical protein
MIKFKEMLLAAYKAHAKLLKSKAAERRAADLKRSMAEDNLRENYYHPYEYKMRFAVGIFLTPPTRDEWNSMTDEERNNLGNPKFFTTQLHELAALGIDAR